MPTTPGYVSNATLANRLSALVDRWDTREDQINALFTQPTGTVPFTDAAGNTTYLPSHTALFTSVQNALDDLAGAYAGAEAYANASNNSAILASQWAENNEDVPVSTGLFSAKHWAMKAAASAAAVVSLDPDLTAIAGLAGNSGFLKKTAANTWTLDTSTYLTSVPAQTWASITGKPTTLSGYGITDGQPLDGDLTAIAALAGAAGLLRKTALNTWSLDTNTYLTSVPAQTWASITGKPTTISGYGITDAYTKTEMDTALGGKQATLVSATNIKTVNGNSLLGAGDITIAGGGSSWGGITGTLSSQTDLQTALNARQPLDADLTAIAALAGTTGFLKKTAADTWALDTSTYLTSVPAQTFASLTGKPTTLSGYGITDAYSSSNPSNYITVASVTWTNLAGKPTTLAGYGITDAQALDADLTAIAALAGATGFLKKTALNTWTLDTSTYLTSVPAQSWSSITGKPTTISGYGITDAYTKTEVDTALGGKQATLVSATNIKTINGNSILGAGDLVVTGGGGSGVWGAITGTLSSQTDLQTALDGKQAALGFTPYNATNPAGYITVASVTWSNLGGKPTTLAGYGITDAQALDADLTAIAALAGTTGLLRKTAANTWSLDTASYLTSVPAQTWASITGKPTTISGYGITDAYTKTEVDTALGGKQATLVSATNIKTINGNSILGSGDLVISGGGGGAATEIDDLNSASNIKFWTGTQAQYDAIGTKDAATTYRITDAVEVPSLTNVSAALSADVGMATSGTWYDGPSISLPAGTWLVTAHTTLWRTATTATTWFNRISTGTVHYASGQMYTASLAGIGGVITLSSIVTVASTTTVKIQSTTSAGAAACLMKAATTANGSGNNATRIQAIRIA